MDIEGTIQEIQEKFNIVGRNRELRELILSRLSKKHVVIEGGVGVGKTTLAYAIAAYFDQGFIRIDGDERYTEAKLVGHFEPPMVVTKGWNWDSFVPGPLTESMKKGSVLFINEANRLIEGTQNVLLPALDEGIISIPKLGLVEASDGFFVVATQNPESFIGTTVLSEALKDRFVWVKLEYQTFEEELGIVLSKLDEDPSNAKKIAEIATKICRATRRHPDIRRGSSVRGGIDLAKILTLVNSVSFDDVREITIMALATKVELEDGVERSVEQILTEIVERVLGGEEDQDFF